MKANEIKKGMVFQYDGKSILVKHLQVQSPSSRSGSTLYKVRGQDLVTQQKFERRFKGDESVEAVDMVRRGEITDAMSAAALLRIALDQ